MTSPHVLHGYTMKDLDDIARTTVINNRHRLALWFLNEAIETAWQGAVEFLCQQEERPPRNKIAYAAWAAVRKDVVAIQKDILPETRRPRETKMPSGARVAQFWNLAMVTRSHEEGVVDRIAFRQVWKELTDAERQVFTCSALCDYNLSAAAEMLGLTRRGIEDKIYRARKHFNALWHDHETPRPMSPKASRRPCTNRASAAKVES